MPRSRSRIEWQSALVARAVSAGPAPKCRPVSGTQHRVLLNWAEVSGIATKRQAPEPATWSPGAGAAQLRAGSLRRRSR